jgi:hypothetical protein
MKRQVRDLKKDKISASWEFMFHKYDLTDASFHNTLGRKVHGHSLSKMEEIELILPKDFILATLGRERCPPCFTNDSEPSLVVLKKSKSIFFVQKSAKTHTLQIAIKSFYLFIGIRIHCLRTVAPVPVSNRPQPADV